MKVAIVTRPVGSDEPYNYLGRDVAAGERFTVFTLDTFESVDTENGIALTEKPDGGYPFFEFPLDAVRIEGRQAATCRHCGRAIDLIAAGWTDAEGFLACVKAPLSTVGHGKPSAFVLHEPMPKGLRGAPS